MRLSDQAASYLFLENFGVPMHTMGLSLLDGDLSLDDARGAITSRLDRIPKYRKKLRFVPFNLAQPTLVDDQNFAIDNHVFSHSLAQGATVEDAFSLAMELGEKPLHREAPLWAMHLISGFGSTLLVHISHLALLDGMSIGEDAHVFFDLHRTTRDRTTNLDGEIRTDWHGLDSSCDSGERLLFRRAGQSRTELGRQQ